MLKKYRKAILVIAVLALGILAAAPFARNLVPTTGNKITVTPADFTPTLQSYVFYNYGYYLYGYGNYTSGVYIPGTKTITQINLYAWDNIASDLCVWLYLVNPIDGTEQNMGQVCSSGSAPGVRVFSDTTISPNIIVPSKGLILWVGIPETSDYLRFYGVRIFYEN